MNGFVLVCVLIVGIGIGAVLSGPISNAVTSVSHLANGGYAYDDDYQQSAFR